MSCNSHAAVMDLQALAEIGRAWGPYVVGVVAILVPMWMRKRDHDHDLKVRKEDREAARTAERDDLRSALYIDLVRVVKRALLLGNVANGEVYGHSSDAAEILTTVSELEALAGRVHAYASRDVVRMFDAALDWSQRRLDPAVSVKLGPFDDFKKDWPQIAKAYRDLVSQMDDELLAASRGADS